MITVTRNTYLLSFSLIALGLVAASAAFAAPTRSAEEETAWLARKLTPISDEDWKLVAGPKTTEQYEIAKGDTLFDISKRLFGDAKYWPKIWALNNQTITNPHLIRPGNVIAFLPGSGTSLPAVAINQLPSNAEPMTEEKPAPASKPKKRAPRSTEWQLLPRQSWEMVPLSLPPEVDANGFDKSNKIRFKTMAGLELEAIAASDKLQASGEIVGSRSEGSFLSMGDTVYIEPDDNLQIGEIYSVTQEPTILKQKNSDRTGYSYRIIGKVKILTVKDNLYIGNIISANHPIRRGSILIPLQPRIKHLSPQIGAKPIEAVVMVDKTISTFTLAQHKLAFVDRGTEDGIQPGMVFRAYEHRDPSTNKRITDSDYIIDADILIVQVSERFSTGIVMRSLTPISEGAKVVLLTDISDITRKTSYKERSTEEIERDKELDDLDALDSGQGLGKDERRELKQLEQWNGDNSGVQKTSDSQSTESETPPATEYESESIQLDPSAELPPPESAVEPESVPESGLESGTEQSEFPASSDAEPPAPVEDEDLPPPPPPLE